MYNANFLMAVQKIMRKHHAIVKGSLGTLRLNSFFVEVHFYESYIYPVFSLWGILTEVRMLKNTNQTFRGEAKEQ